MTQKIIFKKYLIIRVIFSFVFITPILAYSQSESLIDFHTKFENDDHVFTVAHRARTDDNKFPENSFETIEYCIAQGIDVVELDIRETKDKELVIMHDDSVDRTTNGKGKIAEMTLAEIKELYLVNNGEITAFKIPTLDEVFQLTKGKIMIDIDFKAPSEALKSTYELIEKYQIEDQILFFLYDYTESEKVYSLNPKVKVMPRAYSLEDIDEILKLPFIKIIHIDPSFYNSDITQKLRDKKIRVWMNTLGKYDNLERSSENGLNTFMKKYPNINIIQTDLPFSLRKIIHNK